jgi:hypothetical protein
MPLIATMRGGVGAVRISVGVVNSLHSIKASGGKKFASAFKQLISMEPIHFARRGGNK